jgi:hypothetical protein
MVQAPNGTHPIEGAGAFNIAYGRWHLLYLYVAVFPVPLTITWLVTKSYEEEADSTYCGIGYSLLPSYWILEGPRLAAIIVTICFSIFYIYYTFMVV